MVNIPHGDLIEQRRGGVDVLRVLAGTLAAHEQSGAVALCPPGRSLDEAAWLLFRLGQPVMAFYESESLLEGLEALVAIEHDAMEVMTDVLLHELSMSDLRATMETFPESVLHLEHMKEGHSGEEWWSSVRLPSSSWRRALRPEDIESMALESEFAQRPPRQESSATGPQLLPGSVYLLDSPDPHPMIHLATETAQRGLPIMGMFALPHAMTEITKQLPEPQCFDLLSSNNGYTLLSNVDDMKKSVHNFLWSSERSLVLLDGLDRLGNAMGDNEMLNFFRSLVDLIRMEDHVMLCTTDLNLFDTPVQHGLLGECTVLEQSDLDAWLEQPDDLWEHPALLPADEDEERWIEAQLQHQQHDTGLSHTSVASFEGGSVEVNEHDRMEATQALGALVEQWPEQPAEQSAGLQDEVPAPPSQPSTWRPNIPAPFNEGRFISEVLNDAPEVDPQPLPSIKKSKVKQEAVAPSVPKLRTPQRMPRRSAPPSLPAIDPGLEALRSKAVAQSGAALPDWPASRRSSPEFRRENMDGFTQRQERATDRQSRKSSPLQRSSLEANAVASTKIDTGQLPPVVNPKKVPLIAGNESVEPLSSTAIAIPELPNDKAREAAQCAQSKPTMEEIYKRWTTFDEEEGLESTALYNEKGEALERYKGGS
ncbi:MAG: hypothetical protein ACPH8S_02890 [Poseidonia sp.]